MELLKFPDGHALHQTYAWAVPTSSDKTVEDWRIELDPPASGAPCLPIADLKAWVLSSSREVRFLTFDNDRGEKTFRRISADKAFQRYVEAVIKRAGIGTASDAPAIHFLIPALRDDEVYRRYRTLLLDAATAASPNSEVHTLHEPEMVLEFCRVVTNLVSLRQGETSFFLVVDSGAATTNLTVVMSTRAGKMTEAAERRRSHLRAVSSDAIVLGGRAVDCELLRRLAPSWSDAPSDAKNPALREIERAKVRAARHDETESLSLPTTDPVSISRSDLEAVSAWLWEQLRPQYLALAERLLAQLRSGAGERLYGPLVKGRGVEAPEDVGRLFDAVVLAGGTAQLPGFERAMRSSLGLSPQTAIHSVGTAYPVAAAVGGVAHLLAMARAVDFETSEESTTEFVSSLQSDIVMHCQDRTSVRATPDRVTVVERGSAFALHGGSARIALPGSWSTKNRPRARLVLQTGNEEADRLGRRGQGYVKLVVGRTPIAAQAVFDPREQKVRLESETVKGLGALSLDVAKVKLRHPAGRSSAPAPAHAIATRAIHGVVIDIGMSKTLIAHCPEPGEVLRDAFAGADALVPSKPGFNLARETRRGERGLTIHPTPKVHDLLAPQPVSPEDAEPPARPEPERLAKSDKPSGAKALVVSSTGNAPTDAVLGLAGFAAEGGSDVAANAEADAAAESTVQADQESAVLGAASGANAPNDSAKLVYPADLSRPTQLEHPRARIELIAKRAAETGLDVDPKQLALVFLALATRPFVLLSGPPGCGKSTLARQVADILRRVRGDTFHDIAVQAHWVNDDPLFGRNGALQGVLDTADRLHLVLLDEINLARPEYYLARVFGAVEHGSKIDGRTLVTPSPAPSPRSAQTCSPPARA